VSFSASLVTISVGVLEVALLKIQYGNLLSQTPIPAQIYGWTGGFAAFAFLCTWIREIIKDMEDIQGDRELECRTMPIRWGIQKTKYFLYLLIMLTIAAVFHIDYHYIHFDGNLTTRYILFGVAIPQLALGYLILRSKTPADFHQASTLSKLIMLTGVLYSLIFYYLTAKTYHISIFGLFIVK
jgi:4-hydroxybenzoate polyprenyltransferase